MLTELISTSQSIVWAGPTGATGLPALSPNRATVGEATLYHVQAHSLTPHKAQENVLIIPISRISKLRLKEVRPLAQNLTAIQFSEFF